MTPDITDLSPELRRRVDDLRSSLRRIGDDLERAQEEAEDLEARVDGPTPGAGGLYVSGCAHEARNEVAIALEALEEGGGS